MPVAGFARAMAHTTTHRVIAESLRLRLRLRRWSKLRTGQCHSRESSLLFCCSTHPKGTRSSQSGNPALRVPRRFEACSRLNSHCSRRLITSWEEFLLRLLYSLVPTATQLHPTPYSSDRNTDSSVRICCLRESMLFLSTVLLYCAPPGGPPNYQITHGRFRWRGEKSPLAGQVGRPGSPRLGRPQWACPATATGSGVPAPGRPEQYPAEPPAQIKLPGSGCQ